MPSSGNNSNQLLVPGVQQALDQMKFEIAQEFGVQMGPDATSRANGSVGGEITKRLVRQAQTSGNERQSTTVINKIKSRSGIKSGTVF